MLSSAIEQVRARGRLTGAVTGTFTITHTALSGSTLHLRHLDLHGSASRTLQLGTSVHAIGCNDDGIAYVTGTVTSAPDQDIDLQDGSPALYSDLDYLGALAITPEEGAPGWCDARRYGTAPLRWTVPSSIRALAASDDGATAGATGRVRTAGGRPTRYTVAADDRIEDVARRFGITSDDLLYLNPLRERGSDSTLYTGEVLNLDPIDRQWFWR